MFLLEQEHHIRRKINTDCLKPQCVLAALHILRANPLGQGGSRYKGADVDDTLKNSTNPAPSFPKNIRRRITKHSHPLIQRKGQPSLIYILACSSHFNTRQKMLQHPQTLLRFSPTILLGQGCPYSRCNFFNRSLTNPNLYVQLHLLSSLLHLA